jgi:hypothetical protein
VVGAVKSSLLENAPPSTVVSDVANMLTKRKNEKNMLLDATKRQWKQRRLNSLVIMSI